MNKLMTSSVYFNLWESTMKNIELLSPAGSKDAFIAAVKSGADAIYMGGKSFNARQFADNFSDEDFEELIRYAHLAGVKVYVTVNTLLKDEEIESAWKYVKKLYEMKADAIIIQDIGLMQVVSKFLPELSLHGSTQMAATDGYGISIIQNYGIKKVVMGREVPLKRIKKIAEETNVQLEAFIHGALCCAYSGQCYISSFFGGRSGNRGRCAQTCRLAFDIIEKSTGDKLNKTTLYPLSMKELKVGKKIHDLIDAGVTTFKIEGRMRKPEYVDRVVRFYWNIINRIEDHDMENQAEATFNRGFTKGFTFGDFGKNMTARDTPKHRGTELGQVVRINKGLAEIKLRDHIEIGDGVSINDGEKGFAVDHILHRSTKQKISYSEARDHVLMNNFHQMRRGDTLYKTTDSRISRIVSETIKNGDIANKRDIQFKIVVEVGKRIQMKADTNGFSVTITGNEEVVQAKKTPTTSTEIQQQLSKLGGTVFRLSETDIHIEETAFVSKSTINGMRRDALAQLEKLIMGEKPQLTREVDLFLPKKKRGSIAPKKAVYLRDKLDVSLLNLDGIDLLYVPYDIMDETLMEFLRQKQVKWILSMRNASKRADYETVLKICGNLGQVLTGVQADDLDALGFARKHKLGTIHADFQLNIMNSFSAQVLANEGVSCMTHSVESSLDNIKRINQTTSIQTEAIVFSRLPLMTIRNCPLSALKGCENEDNCTDCDWYNKYQLVDRKGSRIPAARVRGITTLFNPIPLNMIDKIKEIVQTDCDFVRIDSDDPEEINHFIQLIDKGLKDEQVAMEGAITRGYYYKEID